MAADIIDRIYEAGIVPEHWPAVLREVAAIGDSKDGLLMVNPQRGALRWTGSEGVVGAANAYLDEGWAPKNTRAARLAPMRYPGFVRDTDIFSPEELEADPFYQGLIKRFGFWHATGTMVYVPTGDLAVFDVHRGVGEPPVDDAAVQRLDALRPHLARAALLAARLGLERAKAMVGALNAIGLPGAVLGHEGRVLAVNALLEALGRQFVTRAFDRMALVDASANAAFQSALDRIGTAAWRPGGLSFPVPAVPDAPALIGHLMPIRRTAADIFAGAVGLLVATPLSAPHAPSEDLLNGLFDLTPAEARVARGVIEGRTVDEVASDLGVSRETVRSQLKAVYAKTGTRRQADLVMLLAGKVLKNDD